MGGRCGTASQTRSAYDGGSGRLAAGKVWGFTPPYGYDYDKETESWVINEDEAQWARRVWQWFGEDVSIRQIRQRLIAAGVKQKGKKPRRHVWSFSSIRKILDRDEYYTEDVIVKWDGMDYKIAVPPIIDRAIYQAVKDRLARYKSYPAGNKKQYFLAAGLVYCQLAASYGACRLQERNG